MKTIAFLFLIGTLLYSCTNSIDENRKINQSKNDEQVISKNNDSINFTTDFDKNYNELDILNDTNAYYDSLEDITLHIIQKKKTGDFYDYTEIPITYKMKGGYEIIKPRNSVDSVKLFFDFEKLEMIESNAINNSQIRKYKIEPKLYLDTSFIYTYVEVDSLGDLTGEYELWRYINIVSIDSVK
jgi:hypothetical protein